MRRPFRVSTPIGPEIATPAIRLIALSKSVKAHVPQVRSLEDAQELLVHKSDYSSEQAIHHLNGTKTVYRETTTTLYRTKSRSWDNFKADELPIQGTKH